MNILFLTLVEINSIEERGIYQDLLRKFRDEGHHVTIVTPVERRRKIGTNFFEKEGVSILQVKTLNIQKTNVLEKGIGTLAIEYQFLSAVKNYTTAKKYDLVLYSTPPITFSKVIEFVKKRDLAKSYLLLKDIFPQNAVDMGMIKNKGILHRFFLKKEKKLYQISDVIGCMSPANLKFILKHHPGISKNKIEVNPNTIEPKIINYSESQKLAIREKYNISIDKKVLVYGGNLGKPQGLDFLLETIAASQYNSAFFLIVGDGTEFAKIQKWFLDNNPGNAKLLRKLSKEDYDQLLAACDIGMVFLDKKFFIPNFPSRLLSYLEMKLPVLVATDENSDMGEIVENAKCGFKVLAGNQEEMQQKLNMLLKVDLKEMGRNAEILLKKEYTVDKSYELIMKRCLNV